MNYSIQLPPISTINFTDGNEVAAYGHLALNLLQSFNLTVGDGRTVQSSSELLKSAREWIVSFEKYAEQITAGQLIPAVGYFDILHRFAYSRPASGEFIGKCCMRAFSERVKGNADISETDLFRAISERIRLNDHSTRLCILRFFKPTTSLPPISLPSQATRNRHSNKKLPYAIYL